LARGRIAGPTVAAGTAYRLTVLPERNPFQHPRLTR
jgi:hypothetical protein